MARTIHNSDCKNTKSSGIEITEKQIKIFARRLLPEIKRFFADEKIQLEFEEWQRKQQENKIE